VLIVLCLKPVYAVEAFRLPELVLISKLRTIGTIALSFGVAADTIIAAALCFFLRRLRTGFESSDSLVHSLSIYAINTGALTSATSITTLVVYNAYPNTFHCMASYFVLGKLYAISFLATLNTRKIIRNREVNSKAKPPIPPLPSNVYVMSSPNGQTKPYTWQQKKIEIEVCSVTRDGVDLERGFSHKHDEH